MVIVPWNCRESLNGDGQEANLFLDSRYGFGADCLYCGTELVDENRDREHVPSKTLLDKDRSFPPNMPTVPSCTACNRSHSKDEQFVSALIECWRLGSTDPTRLERRAVARALERSPGLRAGVEEVLESTSGVLGCARFWDVVQKLVRGHVYFELNRNPIRIEPRAARLDALPADQLELFENPDVPDYVAWPEIGSRLFIDASLGQGYPTWWEVQEDCYRYMVSDGDSCEVRVVISEFVAVHAQAWLDND